MKNKVKWLITLVIIVLLVFVYYLYLNNRQKEFENIKLNYAGINDYFKYELENESEDLFCDLKVAKSVNKGDVASLECYDEYLNFIRFKKEIVLDNILSINDDNLEAILVSNFGGDIYYKVSDRIIVINIIEGENSYRIEVYDNLYLKDHNLVTLSDNEYYSDSISLSSYETNISSNEINSRIIAYLGDGFSHIETID